MMDVEDVKKLKKIVEKELLEKIQNFEKATGCHIETLRLFDKTTTSGVATCIKASMKLVIEGDDEWK